MNVIEKMCVNDNAAAGDACQLIDAGDVQLTGSEICDPASFLASNRGREWMKPILAGAYYTQWYDHNRSPHDLPFCNKIATEVLQAKANGDHCIENVLEEHFSGGEGPENVYDSDHRADVEHRIDDIADALGELADDTLPELDREEWQEAVTDLVVEHMTSNDDSTVLDMFGSCDRAEIVISLNPTGNSIYSQTNCSDFNRLHIDDALAATLAALGYGIAAYRRMSGNKTKNETRRRFRVRPTPIVTPAELREIVSEACSSHFEIVIYAIVPLTDLFELDLNRPLVLSNYSVASYDACNGTFYSVEHAEALILEPGTYTVSGPSGYSPADICGLYLPPFHASARNPATIETAPLALAA